MSWNERTLAVPATPPSVRVARRWVAEVLKEAGRPELIDSAQLGVSELVTNAMLHAEPPLTIRIRGSVEHPRVEVTDQSLEPPHRLASETTGELLVTFGRGLDLVASHATQWGSDINIYGTGKTVWFEPAPEPGDADEVPSKQFSIEEAIAALDDLPSSDDLLPIRLLGMPPLLFTQLRNHFHEIGREVRLLSITEPDRYPPAVEMAELFVMVERERRSATGVRHIDEAIGAGRLTVDLEYGVVHSAPETMRRVGELLEQLYDDDDAPVVVGRPPEPILELQRWYLDQFVRQGRGEDPVRWAGPVEPEQVPDEGPEV